MNTHTKRMTISFTLNLENAETLHEMMWMDSSESENPKIRRVARVVTMAVRKKLKTAKFLPETRAGDATLSP